MKSKSIGLALILILLLVGGSTTTQVSTSLYVTRTENLPGYNFAPFERIVTDTTAVQQLYDTALKLPTKIHYDAWSPSPVNKVVSWLDAFCIHMP